MKQLFRMSLVLLGGLSASGDAFAADKQSVVSESKPNILFIFADDQIY